jgi:hypothetical protein
MAPYAPGNAVASVDRLKAVEPHESRKCHARNRHGKPCGRWAAPWQAVCASHGAKSGQAKRAARRREITAQAAAVVQDRGYAPMDNPVEALLDVAAETRGVSQFLRAEVGRLDDLTHVDKLGVENVAALLSAYRLALRDAGQLLVAVNRLGLDERRVRIEEAKLRPIVDAVVRALSSPEADLDFDTIQRVRSAIADELTKIPTT